MATLEDIKAGAAVRGLTPDGVAKVVPKATMRWIAA